MSARIALTVDLEPDWGVAGTRALREVTPRFLRFLRERGMRATFFVVSDLVEETPELVGAIAERHEVASHGSSHATLDGLDGEQALAEMKGSRERLARCGAEARGFRAPFFRRGPRFFSLLEEAGYTYDASMGSVLPGPWNARLAALGCPFRRGRLYEFPTSAMAGGWLPLSLTWLRLTAPLTRRLLPRAPSLIYLHLHEFLPAESARVLARPLRELLTRNCGTAAWDVLDRALGALDAEFTTCADMLPAREPWQAHLQRADVAI
jgi:peptidoglycan/xylan/chitin deacetylase (PgdA/CDA1 family)